ncbi:hypothetical protein L218DRAFT_1063442 [Marasmius fiardii PR-910]|nr:hypothetical protein L218DRAFT_1063442 [Marasmius fiardii PR-910]
MSVGKSGKNCPLEAMMTSLTSKYGADFIFSVQTGSSYFVYSLELLLPPAIMQSQLGYHKATLWLLLLYLPTLIIPWVLTCVLDKRPLNAPSYYDQSGSRPPKTLLEIGVTVTFVRILNSISGVLVMPVVGSVLAHAAVVYTQRRKVKQELNLLQLFTLANRGWGDIASIWKARSTGSGSLFFWLAMLMVILCAVQQPIQSAFVKYNPILVMSCNDLPIDGCTSKFSSITGYDSEPGIINMLPHNLIVEDVASSIVTVSDIDAQPNLWVDNPWGNIDNDIDGFQTPRDRQMFFWYYQSRKNEDFFVSALDNGTTTGVLRQHAMRMNSSAHCTPIHKDNFPSSCPGTHPIQSSFGNSFINVRVCAPGEVGVSPWSLSRNRQDIAEELYIDMELSPAMGFMGSISNFTIHCSANSTRGYFELGNYRNDYSYGSLLDKWPEPEVLANDYNDYLSTLDSQPPAVEDPSPDMNSLIYREMADPFQTNHFNASGPLMIAASALFGNTSFLNIASKDANSHNLTSAQVLAMMCEHGSIPFALPIELVNGADFTTYCYDIPGRLNSYVADQHSQDIYAANVIGLWLYNRFNDTSNAEAILGMTMFYANKAVLTKSVSMSYPFAARPIYTSPGLLLLKPDKSVAGTIIVTILISLQLLALAALVWYIYSVPTWTSQLDALAVARIGKAVPDDDLPKIGPVSEEQIEHLQTVDGLIGFGDDGDARAQKRMSSHSIQDVTEMEPIVGGHILASSDAQLMLGGQGLITRHRLSNLA